ncbi:hypothetical protein QFC21_004732 [Naganishia friedmannii]|uniref:Uncharacterized protein n=1 Tax=Naganishia friedmannii TaxID=89922 RepID=A0ACC2VFI8_9TREE|nr:hypothetical protein QFC21_004732 [Naganishia friedmannii]
MSARPSVDQTNEEDDELLENEMDALPASDPVNGSRTGPTASSITYKSIYHLPTSERLRGVANRIMFSRYYIIFYLAMTGLSLGTVILSLMQGGCPSTTWHILEIIVNGGMVLEVGTRWVGFGKQYPLTPLNVLDLFLTAFCIITLLLVFLNPCGASSKREEVLDTILLVVRNGVQFWRLGTIIRRSGHSIFHPPRPIDLSQARSAAFDLDLNLDDDEALAAHHMTTNASTGGYQELSTTIPQGGIGSGKAGRAFFDAAEEAEEGVAGTQRQGVFGNSKGQIGYQAGREELAEDDEEQWDRLT